MAFNLSHQTRWRSGPLARAAHPQAAHDYQLLAIAAASQNLTNYEISEMFVFDPDYIDRLYRSTSGRAFVEWFNEQSDEFRKSFRLEEDFQTPPDGATSAGPERAQIIEDPTPVDDPLKEWLQESPTEPTPGE